jgi:hypothetical protein
MSRGAPPLLVVRVRSSREDVLKKSADARPLHGDDARTCKVQGARYVSVYPSVSR